MRRYLDIPEEILLDILSRVPAKSVGLCGCVSKPWRALLSQPNFIKTHLQISKTNSLESFAIIGHHDHASTVYSAPLNNAPHPFDEITLSLTKLTFDGYILNPSYRIGGSCDGLLLVIDMYSNTFVVNPVTREIRQVPRSPFGFAFATNVYCFLHGLGYDSVDDDYKVVFIYCVSTKNLEVEETVVDVYSLKIGSWKRLESSHRDYVGCVRVSSVFVGGCLHWLDETATNYKLAIMAFDLVDEKFRDVPQPSLLLDILGKFCQLDVLGGCLCMYYANEGVGWDVWVMKECGVLESWTKLTVNNPGAWFECFLTDQEQVLMKSINTDRRVLWNLKQGTSREIVFDGFNGTLRVEESFVESLIPPHGRV